MGNIFNSLKQPLACTEPSGGDEAKKKRETKNESIHKDTREQGAVSDSAGLICNQTADHMLQNLKDESTKHSRSLMAVVSKDLSTEPEENCCTNPEVPEDLVNRLSMDTRKSKELTLHRVCDYSLFDYDDHEKLTDHGKSTLEASVNDKMSPNEDITVCIPLDVKYCESTPKDSLKRKAKQRRTNRKVSNQMMVPNENVGALVLSDLQYPGTVRSPTCSKAKALSVCTPEHLKLSTRSGRLLVPRLDPGTQNIIYDRDGSILGITNQSSNGVKGSIRSLRLGGRKGGGVHPPSMADCCYFDGAYYEMLYLAYCTVQGACL